MAFCLPTPIAPQEPAAPVVTAAVAESDIVAPVSLTPVAASTIPLPCLPE